MGEHVIKLPDVGEGVAEAELVEWHVAVGDLVREDTVVAAVMTDKATVEIPSPVDGEIVWLGARIGDTVAVGSPLVRLKVEGEGNIAEAGTIAPPAPPAPANRNGQDNPSPGRAESGLPLSRPVAGARRQEGEKPLASPAVRLRAMESGIDLRQLHGSGPAGRIVHDDIDAFLRHGPRQPKQAGFPDEDNTIEEIRVVGLRRRIAEKMALARARIPHITYVEEIDVTALEEMRAAFNREKMPDRPGLTLLPFLMRAMVRAIREQPGMNALFDDEAGVIRRHGGIHIGIAAQTRAGLVVPVVKHAEARDLWNCAAEVNRLAEAARDGTATRDELSGSTITITSLGAMGGIVTTPVINHPEVAIIGVNKIMVRPAWDGSGFVPRKMMNLSSSFDHRVIDGWDAAVFIQRIKALLETPALTLVDP